MGKGQRRTQQSDSGQSGTAPMEKSKPPEGEKAAVPPPAGAWQPGKVVADIYEVVRELGRGGMGVVYLLQEQSAGKPAAAKLPTGRFITNQELRRRFTREAEVWTQLAAHPNIVRAYDVQEVDYHPCIFMEYMDGGSVADVLRGHSGGLPFEEAFSIAIQTCWGMAFAHQMGHIHRDLKPANLLRTGDGVVKVTDFGLVRPVSLDEAAVRNDLAKLDAAYDAALADSMTQGKAMGTAPYMAPEQWEGESVPATDVYAFGVVLCELFCGRRPLDLRTHPKYRDKLIDPDPWVQGYFYKQLHQQEEPVDPDLLRGGLPSGVRDVILRCLSKQPDKRPEDFDTVADELVRAYQGATGRAFPLEKPGAVELDQQQKRDRAWALTRLGAGCKFRGDLDEAMSLYRQSERLFQETDDRAGMAHCYNNIGVILKRRGDYDGAVERYQQSLDIAQELGDRAQMSRCHGNMGIVLSLRGDYDGGLERYQQSLDIAQELGDRAGMLRCYNNMGETLKRRGGYDGALERFQQSLDISQELGDRDGMSHCYTNMGEVMRLRGDYDSAMERYQQSLGIAQELGDRAQMLDCYICMGVILDNCGDYDGAMERYQQSLEIAQELDDRDGMSRSYNNMGEVLRLRGDYDGAMQRYQQSLEMAQELGDRDVMSVCYSNMGEVLRLRGDYSRALELYQQSLGIAQELGDRAEMSHCYRSMGEILRLRGDYDGAMELFQQSLEIKEELGNSAGMSVSYTNMGIALRLRGDYDSAMEQHQQSLEIREELQDRTGMSICYSNMGMVYEDRSDREQALDMYRRSMALIRELDLPVPDWLSGKIGELGG